MIRPPGATIARPRSNSPACACRTASSPATSQRHRASTARRQVPDPEQGASITTRSNLPRQRFVPQATVTLLHPGTTDTELSKPFQSFVPPEKLFSPKRAADQLLTVLLKQTPSDSGAFLAWDGQSIAW